MNNFLKWTVLGLTLSTLVSAHANATMLTCTSESNKSVVATVQFHEYGFINEIRLESPETNDVMFSAENDDQQIISFNVSAKDLKTNNALAGMKMKAKIGNKKYKNVDFQAVVSKEGSAGDLNDVTDYIFDDGAGFGLLRFNDANNNLIGASLFLGWAGIFNNCK